MYRFFFLIILLTITSCSFIPEKSVLEELSDEELNSAMKEDGFDEMFSRFFEYNQPDLSSLQQTDRARFLDVTYRSLFSFYNEVIRTRQKFGNKFFADWEEMYGNEVVIASKLDSIITFWNSTIAGSKRWEYYYELPRTLRQIVDRRISAKNMDPRLETLYNKMNLPIVTNTPEEAFNLYKECVDDSIIPYPEYILHRFSDYYQEAFPNEYSFVRKCYSDDFICGLFHIYRLINLPSDLDSYNVTEKFVVPDNWFY